MELLIVGIGGALGTMARYLLGRMVSAGTTTRFPVGTFLINLSGAFLLGIVINAGITGSPYLLLADGFLGAFTTFSTFLYEGFNLIKDNRKLNAIIYVTGSIILGIAGFIAGMTIAGIFR